MRFALTTANMELRIHTILLPALLLASGIAGQQADPNKKPGFLYPPDGSNNIYNMLDTIMVTYYGFYENADLFTFCQPGVGKLSECTSQRRAQE